MCYSVRTNSNRKYSTIIYVIAAMVFIAMDSGQHWQGTYYGLFPDESSSKFQR